MADQFNQAASPSGRQQKRGTGVFLPRTAAVPAPPFTNSSHNRAVPRKAKKSQQLCSSRAPSTASSSHWQHQHPDLLSHQQIEMFPDLKGHNSWPAAVSQFAAQSGQHMPASDSHANNGLKTMCLPTATCPSSTTIAVQGVIPSAVAPDTGLFGATIISASARPNYTDSYPVNGFNTFPRISPADVSADVLDAYSFRSSTVLGPQAVTAAAFCISNHSSSSSWQVPARQGLACTPMTSAHIQQSVTQRSSSPAVRNSPADICAGSVRAAAAAARSSSHALMEGWLSQEVLTCSSSGSSAYALCMNSSSAVPYSCASTACSNTGSMQSSPFANQAVQQKDGTWQGHYNVSCGAGSHISALQTAVQYLMQVQHNSHALPHDAPTSPSVYIQLQQQCYSTAQPS